MVLVLFHRRRVAAVGDGPLIQSGSLSGRPQTSRRRLAMTRQAVGEISMPIMVRKFSRGWRTIFLHLKSKMNQLVVLRD